MVIKIKSPNSDEIWDKWKRKSQSSQNLEKHYRVKGASFTLDSITAAEYVKNVEKGAIFFFEEGHDVKPSDIKPETKIEKVSKIQKIKFFDFQSKVDKATWKYNEAVPFFPSLEKQRCSKCNGSGGIKCEKCNNSGKITCPKCKGNPATLRCESCNGSGNVTIDVEVIDYKGESSIKQSQVICPDCLGKKQHFCMKCGGFGKIGCGYCDGKGVNLCNECKGYGVVYKYRIQPVPFKESHSKIPKLYSSIDMKGLEQEIGQEIQKTIETVEGILIQKPNKELDKKFIEPNLGFFEKPIKKALKIVTKDWKSAESNSDINIRLPMYLFPVLCLHCETKKGKKFKIYAIGSDRKYRIFGKI